jgi:hypothetical protein
MKTLSPCKETQKPIPALFDDILKFSWHPLILVADTETYNNLQYIINLKRRKPEEENSAIRKKTDSY